MSNPDVLIVGSGPTGLALALELACQQVSFRIIEKEPQRSPYSLAGAIQPRTLELLHRHGSIARLVEGGHTVTGASFLLNKKLVTEVDVASLTDDTRSQFPNIVSVPQRELERWLEDAMHKYDASITIERGVTAKSITQDADFVTVTLDKNGVEETIKTKYIIGCDGVHSVVRGAAKNIKFPAAEYPQDVILADLHIKWEHAFDRLYLCLGKGLLAVIPLGPGMVRLVASRTGPNVRQEGDPTLQDFQNFVPDMMPGTIELSEPSWLSRIRLTHGLASNYRDKRIFLAGDAAHPESPISAQGMNAGMQDAINLGWKLAAVLRGEKEPAFLDSYNAERRRVGQHLVKTTDRQWRYATSSNPLRRLERNCCLPSKLKSKKKQQRFFRFATEFGINYRHSPIVKTATEYSRTIMAGDRPVDQKCETYSGQEVWFQDLLTADSYHLVFFSGAGFWKTSEREVQVAKEKFLEAGVVAPTKVHLIFSEKPNDEQAYFDKNRALHQAYHFSTRAGYIVVRPDGYVGRVGPLTDMDGLIEWMKQK